ncbi:hypothetical protein FE257_001488 [Aspergillus nanangensis]|uniref:Uncharacterized protein n=1 Tax=Aspergillus nanangensis TaxID=2582783 RepID=A0AAD4CE09_ASPNN|nr:hypothetical protein FE257_001488 [Aspergillus nanangensis]
MLDKTLPVNYPAEPIFDITEDWYMDVEGSRPSKLLVDLEAIRLLYNPLPHGLPTVDKDLLILMAAWSGNIDRYIRLRRPKMQGYEIPCVIRGIHNHPLFSKWWSLQPDSVSMHIRQVINARSIMSNDLPWLHETTPDSHLPVLIWYPQCAGEETYEELACRRPSMIPQIARASIHADY